ncbi:MAG: response regulator, partial [Syntrophales bacterium]|nr:response regulator [Syntrophales bacterium]
MKILVVDDEDVTLSSMKRLLRWQGIKDVETCDSGKDAIRRIKAGDYDIVLLDLLMPEVDGIQVLESSKPFKPQTEFIIITAVDVIAQAVKAVRLGAYDYLVKPVDNEHLMRVLERAYERRGLMAGMNLARQARDAKHPEGFSAIVTESPQIRALLSYAQIMAKG